MEAKKYAFFIYLYIFYLAPFINDKNALNQTICIKSLLKKYRIETLDDFST